MIVPKKTSSTTKKQKGLQQLTTAMTHLISCLPDDLLTMLGDHIHDARLKVWRQEHRTKLSPLLTEFSNIVAEAPDYDGSVFDDEIQGLLVGLGEDERLDFCMDNEGEEWEDGRTIIEPCRPNYAVGLLREIEDMKY